MGRSNRGGSSQQCNANEDSGELGGEGEEEEEEEAAVLKKPAAATPVTFFVGYDPNDKAAWRATSSTSPRELSKTFLAPEGAKDEDCMLACWPDGWQHEVAAHLTCLKQLSILVQLFRIAFRCFPFVKQLFRLLDSFSVC